MARLGLFMPVTAFVVALVSSAVLSLIVYALIEAPTTRWLRSWMEARPNDERHAPRKRGGGRVSTF